MKLALLSIGINLVSGFISPQYRVTGQQLNPLKQEASATRAFVPYTNSMSPLTIEPKNNRLALFDTSQEELPKIQNDEEIRKKLFRLEKLARTLTGDNSLSLEAGETWAYKPKTNTLVFPKADLDHISDEAAIALIARESGHRQYTSYPPEVAYNPAFKLLFNTIEQIRINRYMSGRHLGYHPLAFIAFKQFQLIRQTPSRTEAIHKQFCLGLIEQSFGENNPQWAQSEIVRQALDEAREYVEKATEIPINPRDMLLKGLSADEIAASSAESYEIIKDKIWPIFQRLLASETQNEQSQDSEESTENSNSSDSGSTNSNTGEANSADPNQEQANTDDNHETSNSGNAGERKPDGSESNSPSSEPAQGEPSDHDLSKPNTQEMQELAKNMQEQWNRLSPEQQRQIEELARDMESKLGEADPSNLDNPEQKPQSGKEQSQQENVDRNKKPETSKPSDTDQQQADQDSDGQDGDGQDGDGQDGDGQDGDGQAGDGQDGDGQDGNGQAGDGQAGDGQAGDGQAGDGQTGNMASGSINSNSANTISQASNEGIGSEDNGYQQHADNQQRLMELIEEFKKRSSRQDTPDSYEHFKARNKQLIDELSEEVRHIFEDDSEPQFEGDYRSGIYNLQKAIESKARSRATGHKDDKIFLRKNHPEEKSVEIVICLDTSGSMSGERISYAKDAVVVVGEMANNLRISWGLLTFANNIKLLKELNSEKEEHSWEQDLVNADANGGTDDFAALEKAVEMFTESDSRAEKKLIVFMTDGSGNYRQSEFVKEIQEEGYWVIGVGIGEGTSYVSETYDRSIHVPNVEDLPLELAELLLNLLREDNHS